MDATQFTQAAREDPQLRDFVQEVAGDVAGQVSVEQPQQYLTVTGVEFLFALAAYALYRWMKDYFDYRRAHGEVKIVTQQERVIAALIEDGFPPEQA